MEEERVEKALMDLGLQKYEAEVYRVLVELGEATVREISTRCSVPREKIYFILKNLEKSGIVRLVEKEPKRYIAMPPEEIFKESLALQKRKYKVARMVVDHLQKIYERGFRHVDKRELKFWELGRETFEKIISLIDSSSRYIYMVISPRYIHKIAGTSIYDRLKRLAKRGIDINIYTWFAEENIKFIGRLTNVAKVYILENPSWDVSLILSDEDRGQLIFSDHSSIYFINRKIVEFYINMLIGLETKSLSFEEVDKILSIDEVPINTLMSTLFHINTLHERVLSNMFTSLNSGVDPERLRGLLYNSIDKIIPLSKMSMYSTINLISYLTNRSNIKISFSESNNTLLIEIPWSPEVDSMINNGQPIPPSPWIYIFMEYLRRKGYKEQMTTVIHYRAEGKVHFIKHFIKA